MWIISGSKYFDRIAVIATAFYTYEEFEMGVETLWQFCSLHSESISMQLENGETTENMGYAAASPSDVSGWIWISISAALLVIGLIVVKKYK